MAGDNPAEERKGDPDEFLSKPRWQRVLIALAGPTTNFLMAVILTAALFVRGGQQPSYADKPVVIAGVMKDSAAQKAGIQAGDRIVSFAGVKNPTWDRVALELALSAPGRSEPRRRRTPGPAGSLERGERAATFYGHRVSSRARSDRDSEPRIAGGKGRISSWRHHPDRGRGDTRKPLSAIRHDSAKPRPADELWRFRAEAASRKSCSCPRGVIPATARRGGKLGLLTGLPLLQNVIRCR